VNPLDPDPLSTTRKPEVPTLRIALISDTQPAGRRAMQSCQRVAEQVAGDVQVRTEVWKASALGLPGVEAAAQREFARADVVMVAGEDGAPLSEPLRAFLRTWAAGIDSARTPLLAYHTPAMEIGDQAQALEFLSEIVREAHCDFIGQLPGPRVADCVTAGRRIVAAREHALACRQPPASHPASHWGIDE
jgi:hypothetical protein